MKKGRGKCEQWPRAKELAEQGCWLSEAARILKIHHTTALYISRQMGFTWGKCPAHGARFKPLPQKSVGKKVYVSSESVEYVERLMQLAEV